MGMESSHIHGLRPPSIYPIGQTDFILAIYSSFNGNNQKITPPRPTMESLLSVVLCARIYHNCLGVVSIHSFNVTAARARHNTTHTQKTTFWLMMLSAHIQSLILVFHINIRLPKCTPFHSLFLSVRCCCNFRWVFIVQASAAAVAAAVCSFSFLAGLCPMFIRSGCE